MKSYRETMDQLRFSPQQKQAMVERLMNESARPPKEKFIPLRRFSALGAVAALAATLCLGAGAAGVLKPAAQAFASILGGSAAQTRIIDQIGYLLDARDTVDGITVQADAIIGDTYSYAIVYSVFREDGQPLAEGLAADAEGRLPLRFDTWGADVGHMGGTHGTAYFFDEDPADNAVQFVEFSTADSPLGQGTAAVQLAGLEWRNGDAVQVLADGSWNLRFDFAFADSSLTLPGGQTVQVNGESAVVNSVSISPLSFRIDYTVDAPVQQSTSAESSPQLDQYLHALDVTLTLTDGTRLPLNDIGGGVRPEEDTLRCEISGVFEQILPLETIASISFGDTTIPVTSQ